MPPEIRKNTQTLTIRLNPNDREMYSNTIGLKPVSALVVELFTPLPAPMFATCVPAKAKNKNIVVPMNSPSAATKSIHVSAETSQQTIQEQYVRLLADLFIHSVKGNLMMTSGGGLWLCSFFRRALARSGCSSLSPSSSEGSSKCGRYRDRGGGRGGPPLREPFHSCDSLMVDGRL